MAKANGIGRWISPNEAIKSVPPIRFISPWKALAQERNGFGKIRLGQVPNVWTHELPIRLST